MSLLANYGLRDPFVPSPARRPLPPQIEHAPAPIAPVPPLPRADDGIQEFADVARQISSAGDEPRDVLSRVDDFLRSLAKSRPDIWSAEASPRGAAPYRAMAPTAGPDTGDIDPNVAQPTPGGYFSKLRGRESGGDPAAVNATTGAGGLYQFLPSTWEGIRREAPHLNLAPFSEGFRDARQQSAAVDYYTQKSIRQLVPLLGRMPTPGELYSLHFFGHGGGENFLRNLDRPLGEVLGDAVFNSNPWLKAYRDKAAASLLQRLEKMMS